MQQSTHLDAFLKTQPIKRYQKDRPIYYQGEIPRIAYVIKEGIVRVFGITAQGEEKIINYHAKGDLIPTGWLFNKSPVSMYYYSAFTDCELYAVIREELRDYISKSNDALNEIVDRYMTHYVASTIHIHALEQSRAQDKIMRVLQFLVMRFGREILPGEFLINLRLTHQELANMVGLTRETTAVEVGKLKKRRIISYEKSYYRVKYDQLLRTMGEDEFKDVHL